MRKTRFALAVVALLLVYAVPVGGQEVGTQEMEPRAWLPVVAGGLSPSAGLRTGQAVVEVGSPVWVELWAYDWHAVRH